MFVVRLSASGRGGLKSAHRIPSLSVPINTLANRKGKTILAFLLKNMSPILARLIGRQLRSVERGSFASRSLTSLSISKEEKQSRRLNQRSMQTSLEALHRDGIVIIEDAVNKSTIDALNERMEIDTRILIERGEQGPFNYNLGNLQQSPPFELSTFAPDIFVNPIATQLTSAYLGGRPTLSFISSNAAVKAEQGQPIHCDADFDHPKVRKHSSSFTSLF